MNQRPLYDRIGEGYAAILTVVSPSCGALRHGGRRVDRPGYRLVVA